MTIWRPWNLDLDKEDRIPVRVIGNEPHGYGVRVVVIETGEEVTVLPSHLETSDE